MCHVELLLEKFPVFVPKHPAKKYDERKDRVHSDRFVFIHNLSSHLLANNTQ